MNISVEEGVQLLIGKGTYKQDEAELARTRINDLVGLGVSVENAVGVLSTKIEVKKTQQFLVLAQIRRKGIASKTEKPYDILNTALLDLNTYEIYPSVRLGTQTDKPETIISRFAVNSIVEGTIDVSPGKPDKDGFIRKYTSLLAARKVSDGMNEKELIMKINTNPKFNFDKTIEEITKKLSEFEYVTDAFAGKDGVPVETKRCKFTFPIVVGITGFPAPTPQKITVKADIFSNEAGKRTEVTLNYPYEMIDKIYQPNSRIIVIGELNINSKNQMHELASIDVYVSYAVSGMTLSKEDKENIMIGHQESGIVNKQVTQKQQQIPTTVDIDKLIRGG